MMDMMIKATISLFLLCLIYVDSGSAGLTSRTRGEDADTTGTGRGFVGYINQQDLPWKEFLVKGAASGLKVKTLSRNPKTGAASLLLSYPPGWRSSNYYSVDEEIFVLEGDLTIGERTLTDRCYSFIPAGKRYGPISTRNGCLALTYFNKEPEVAASSGSVDGTIEYKNFYEEPWQLGITRSQSKTPPPLLIKLLRQDEETGARTWIAGVLADQPNSRWEKHPTWEEGYLLEGEFRLEECLNGKSKMGMYKAGGYFFRPAGIAHVGPKSDAIGYAIWLFRTPAKLGVEFLEKTDCK